MPATTKKTPEGATKAVKTKKATATAAATATAENTKRKKKVTIESADLVVVGPVAESTPPTVFESGSRPSRIGNAFEVTLTATGDLVVRYHDRAGWFGPAMKAVVVNNPGRGETVVVIDLALNGATHEGRLQLSPETATVALAFTGAGRWDSNESRNYQVNLKP